MRGIMDDAERAKPEQSKSRREMEGIKRPLSREIWPHFAEGSATANKGEIYNMQDS
jgi:hypothetical protein